MMIKKYSVEFLKSIADELGLGQLYIDRNGRHKPSSLNVQDEIDRFYSPKCNVQKKYSIEFLKAIARKLDFHFDTQASQTIRIDHASLSNSPSVAAQRRHNVRRKYSMGFLKDIGRRLKLESYLSIDNNAIDHSSGFIENSSGVGDAKTIHAALNKPSEFSSLRALARRFQLRAMAELKEKDDSTNHDLAADMSKLELGISSGRMVEDIQDAIDLNGNNQGEPTEENELHHNDLSRSKSPHDDHNQIHERMARGRNRRGMLAYSKCGLKN